MKTVLLLGAVLVLALLAAYPAYAGLDDYCTQPGCEQAASHTECSGHGSFGAFGKGENLGIANSPGNGDQQHAPWTGSYPGPGTDGTQTGENNSNLCGNPQN